MSPNLLAACSLHLCAWPAPVAPPPGIFTSAAGAAGAAVAGVYWWRSALHSDRLLLVTQLQRHGISSGGAEGPGQGLQWQLHVSNCLHCTRCALIDDRPGASFSRCLIRAGAELLLVLIDHLGSPRQLHAAWVGGDRP